jgi:hypothetical protein
MYEIVDHHGYFVARMHTLGEAMWVVRHRATVGMRCTAVFGNQRVYWAW